MAIALASCESSTYEDISAEVANPTYQANIKQIMSNNCTSCHSVDGNQEPFLETYDQVRDATENGVLLEEIEAPSGQGMPESGRMPQSTINTINNWIAQGYANE